MNKLRRCGSDCSEDTKHDGCFRYYDIKEMYRCHQCGILLCDLCYIDHLDKHRSEKGGDK